MEMLHNGPYGFVTASVWFLCKNPGPNRRGQRVCLVARLPPGCPVPRLLRGVINTGTVFRGDGCYGAVPARREPGLFFWVIIS